MTTKNLVVLAVVAGVLGGAAYLTGGNGKAKSPKLNGEKLVGAFDVSSAASIDIGDKVKLAAGDAGWTIATMQDYPADRAKIAENLMKLQELKVGQVARGRQLAAPLKVAVRDAAGKDLAALTLGERHEKWGMGRYATYKGETVLVGETLDAFGDDPKAWCSTKIVDTPWISFKELADPALTEAELGFATGVVAKVTIAGDTNRVATVGATVKDGTDRYLKIDGLKWTFIVPSYSVESLLPKPEPKDEPKEEPATEEAPAAAEPAASEEAPAAKPAADGNAT
ncbi:MAG: DUF4340 domain-containing protein [Kiritimatiellia bacterium]